MCVLQAFDMQKQLNLEGLGCRQAMLLLGEFQESVQHCNTCSVVAGVGRAGSQWQNVAHHAISMRQ